MLKPSITQVSYGCFFCSTRTVAQHSRTFISKTTLIKSNPVENKKNAQLNELRTIFKNQNLSEQEWYQISAHQLDERSTKLLNSQFRGSFVRALSNLFPETDWHPWKFNSFTVPKDYWKEPRHQKKFFDDLGNQLGIRNMDDWYEKLSKSIIVEHGGIGLLHRHKDSPLAALTAVYPEHNWIPWKFASVPDGYWKNPANLRKFFDEVGKKLNIQILDDWYDKLSKQVIMESGGIAMLKGQYRSGATALMAAYPEHNWIPWKFKVVPDGYWKSKENVSKFLAELSEKLSIQTLDDWYRVDLKQLQQFGAATLVQRYRGLYRLLKEQYPHHSWNMKRFQHKGKKAQRWLAVTLKKMFPDEEILEDYNHPKVMLPSSNRPLQLDVFIPSKSLAFEYQGIQHYQEVGVFGPAKTYQQRDEEKRTLCASNNIKLIEVPYWWNRTQESIQEMIAKST